VLDDGASYAVTAGTTGVADNVNDLTTGSHPVMDHETVKESSPSVTMAFRAGHDTKVQECTEPGVPTVEPTGSEMP